jgi:hypothetical protein
MAESQHWARSLRVIGQDISKFKPGFLEIELTGDTFVARGSSVERDPNPCPSSLRNVLSSCLKLLEKNPKKDSDQSSLRPFSLRYTPQDIDKLDEEWARRRGTADKNPDLYSLPELLRTVGRYIDSEEGELLKVAKEMGTLTLHFQDRNGHAERRECSIMERYKRQQDIISKRRTLEIKDIWKHYEL